MCDNENSKSYHTSTRFRYETSVSSWLFPARHLSALQERLTILEHFVCAEEDRNSTCKPIRFFMTAFHLLALCHCSTWKHVTCAPTSETVAVAISSQSHRFILLKSHDVARCVRCCLQSRPVLFGFQRYGRLEPAGMGRCILCQRLSGQTHVHIESVFFDWNSGSMETQNLQKDQHANYLTFEAQKGSQTITSSSTKKIVASLRALYQEIMASGREGITEFCEELR